MTPTTWKILDWTLPEDAKDSINRGLSIDEVIAALDRMRLEKNRFITLDHEGTRGGFMIALGQSSAYVRYQAPDAPLCPLRLLPLHPLVKEELHYESDCESEYNSGTALPDRLLTIEQFYALLRHIENYGEIPEFGKTQYDWE